MDEREIDRSIDVATQEMMAREPSRALGYNVMARVRDDAAPAPWRFVWMTAAATLVLLAAIAIAVTSRTPVIIAPLPSAAQLPVKPPAVPNDPIIVAEAVPTRRTIPAVRGASSVRSRVPLPLTDASPIEPIQTEPIVLSTIDVPRLEPEAPTLIEALEIDELTIEPLAASND